MSATTLGSYWVTAFLSGSGVLVCELVATRALAPFFGQALFVWTNVIGLVLLGLAVGSTVGGKLADRFPRPEVLAWLLLAAAALVASAAFTPGPVARALLPDELPLEAAYPFLLRGSFVTTLVCFLPPVLLLGAVAPFLVRCATDDVAKVGSRAGMLYGASTLGSIVGTFATSHLLLPSLGTRGSMLLAAALLALSAVPLWLSRGRRTSAATTAAVAIATGLAVLHPAVRAPSKGAAKGELIAAWDSAYQHIEVRDRGELGVVLALDEGHDSYQSILPAEGVLTDAYYDTHTLLASQCIDGDRLHVLVAGLAGGTHARQLLHFYGHLTDLQIVGVEIDPKVVEVSREHLELPDDPRLTVIAGLDARVYVENTDREFDLILVDCYTQQSFIPFHLASREFFTAARRCLRSGGWLGTNVTAFGGQDPVLVALSHTLSQVFGPTVIALVPSSTNYLVVARKEELALLPVDWHAETEPGPLSAAEEARIAQLEEMLEAVEEEFNAQKRALQVQDEESARQATAQQEIKKTLDRMQEIKAELRKLYEGRKIGDLLRKLAAPGKSWWMRPGDADVVLNDDRTELDWLQARRLAARARRVLGTD